MVWLGDRCTMYESVTVSITSLTKLLESQISLNLIDLNREFENIRFNKEPKKDNERKFKLL